MPCTALLYVAAHCLSERSPVNAALHTAATLIARLQNLERPDAEEEDKVAEETWAALSKVVESKILVAQPKTLPVGSKPGEPEFIKYTPAQQGPQVRARLQAWCIKAGAVAAGSAATLRAAPAAASALLCGA